MNKKKLYNKAVEAYYSGEEIMPNATFDKLERELGLTNKKLGSSHSNNYTVKHPVIMGSLLKVQIHNHSSWEGKFQEVVHIIKRYGAKEFVITPKFDGCSFEWTNATGSTRGDGETGKDITPLVRNLFLHHHLPVAPNQYLCFRGELLMDKTMFQLKYADKFKNPRSVISGLVNSDWDESMMSIIPDISMVIYDYKKKNKSTWEDKDWFSMQNMYDNVSASRYVFLISKIDTPEDLKSIYYQFEEYRKLCPVPLDGFVIKPLEQYRNKQYKEYPDDCVAIKFKPQLVKTNVTGIEWNLGKTGEYIPTVLVKPVVMDGKTIGRVSGANYGNIISSKLFPGAKVTISLAGDIIPFIYRIDKPGEPIPLPLPESEVVGCHLMSKLTSAEKLKRSFINSALTLQIPNIGEAIAEQIWNNLSSRHRKFNILLIKPHTLYKALGRTQTAKNAKDGFTQVLENLTLSEIIQSCNFTSCGKKVSDQIARYIVGWEPDFSHLPEKAYSWCKYDTSAEYMKVYEILRYLEIKTLDYFRAQMKEVSGIPVILTGKPNNYATKGEFLKAHPEYVETTSWSEVKIVFTNSLDETSNKMKKAREKGIDIQIY